jgi:hypothetical protein
VSVGHEMVPNGLSALWLQPWMARASTVFPVPLGPRSKTTASEAATCRASSTARCKPGCCEVNETSGCNRGSDANPPRPKW